MGIEPTSEAWEGWRRISFGHGATGTWLDEVRGSLGQKSPSSDVVKTVAAPRLSPNVRADHRADFASLYEMPGYALSNPEIFA
jgi:hypothetical protein